MFDSCYLQLQGEYNKPEGILFYNSGKAGVDTRNRGAYIYNNKRITRRWPHAVFCYILGISTDNARVILLSMMPSIVPPTRKSGRKDFNLKLSRQLVRAKMGQMVYRPHLDDLVKEALHRKYGIPRPRREVARAVHHLPGRRRKLCITTGCNNRTHNTCDYCGAYRCRNCSTTSYSCSKEMQCLQRRQ